MIHLGEESTSEVWLERALSESDLAEAYEIEAAVYDEPWSLTLFSESLKAPMTHTLAQFSDGSLRAYAIFQMVLGEGHLLNIAVHPKFQNQGRGAILLDHVLNRCRQSGIYRFFLEVRPSNLHAQKLYESRGFRTLTVRERYYSNGEAALVMFLDL